jgi:hypothetical protein
LSIRARLTSLSRRQWFFITVGVALLLKLWLVSEIRVVPYDAPWDASNFMEHAKFILMGQWFGPYDAYTLVKGPAFPVYMALVQEFGLPLPLAHQLLYAGACLIACFAIRPLDRRGFAAPIVFVVLLFDPFTYGTMSWVTYRSQLYECAALFCVACAVGAYIRRDRSVPRIVPWLVGLGCSLAVFALTREESVWIVPAMLVSAAAWIAFAWTQRRSELRLRIAVLGIPLVIWLGANGAVALINGIKYGWATVVEMQAPEFHSAYNALARIDVPVDDRWVTVPRAARMIAYGVSPAARELRQSLDGEGSQGRTWVRVSCSQGYNCSDIPEGWFIFAFRVAVAEAGHYKSGSDARAFYVRLAAEIDRACDGGAIRCRRKGTTLSPPILLGDIPTIGMHFLIDVQKLLTLETFQLAHWPALPTSAALQGDYEFVTRATLPSAGTTYVGWMPHERLKAIRVIDAQGNNTRANIAFEPSPDIYAYFLHDPLHKTEETGLARFTIVSPCSSGCSLVVTGERGDDTTVPLDMSSRSIRTPHLTLFLDSITSDSSYSNADDHLKQGALASIAWLYRLALPFLFVVASIQVLMRLVSRRRLAPESDHAIVFASAISGVASLLMVLAVIDVVAFAPSFVPEYVSSAVPLLLFSVSAVLAIEAERSRSLVGQARLYTAAAVVLLVCLGIARLVTTAKAPDPTASRTQSFACPVALVAAGDGVSGSIDAATLRDSVVPNGAAVAQDAVLVFKGWAADSAVTHPLAGVCLLADGKPLPGQQVDYGVDRPDVVRTYSRPALERSGYLIHAPLTSLERGRHRLEVVGVGERGTGGQIGGVLEVDVR